MFDSIDNSPDSNDDMYTETLRNGVAVTGSLGVHRETRRSVENSVAVLCDIVCGQYKTLYEAVQARDILAVKVLLFFCRNRPTQHDLVISSQLAQVIGNTKIVDAIHACSHAWRYDTAIGR
jgi:hypothetical protein